MQVVKNTCMVKWAAGEGGPALAYLRNLLSFNVYSLPCAAFRKSSSLAVENSGADGAVVVLAVAVGIGGGFTPVC
jgi:hypothetical protein